MAALKMIHILVWLMLPTHGNKDLIDSGYADAVMTSHIVNRKLDKNGYPGTLSTEILTGLLRKKLGFNGVIFTDDMQMHAIAKNFGLEEAIKLAINGGVDIMTFSNNISGSEERTVDRVHHIIRAMVKRGEISQQRIDESFRRIMQLKGKLDPRKDFYHEEFLQTQALLKQKEEAVEQKAALEKILAEEWERRNQESETGKKHRKKKKK
jgi:beta-N-acetylhexosaminidase